MWMASVCLGLSCSSVACCIDAEHAHGSSIVVLIVSAAVDLASILCTACCFSFSHHPPFLKLEESDKVRNLIYCHYLGLQPVLHLVLKIRCALSHCLVAYLSSGSSWVSG